MRTTCAKEPRKRLIWRRDGLRWLTTELVQRDICGTKELQGQEKQDKRRAIDNLLVSLYAAELVAGVNPGCHMAAECIRWKSQLAMQHSLTAGTKALQWYKNNNSNRSTYGKYYRKVEVARFYECDDLIKQSMFHL